LASGRTYASTGGVLVVDGPGVVFAALCAARLGVALWRTTAKTVGTHDLALAVVASYQRPDWTAIVRLADQVRTVVMALNPDDEQANHALALGAFGYVPATLSPLALRRAILGAINGEPAFSRRLLAEALRSATHRPYGGRALALTPRQREVVALIAQGAADKEIAAKLGITTPTAQKHVTNLLKRLNVPNRAAAAAMLVSSMSRAVPDAANTRPTTPDRQATRPAGGPSMRVEVGAT
jgi:DNA-binding NarL/FixJ family response regulator